MDKYKMLKLYSTGLLYFVTSGYLLWKARHYILLIEKSKIIYHVSDLKHIDINDKKDQSYLVQGVLQNDGLQKYLMVKSVCLDKYSKKGQVNNLNKLFNNFNVGSRITTRVVRDAKLVDRGDKEEKIKLDIQSNTKILGDCLNQISQFRVEKKQSIKQYIVSFFQSIFLRTQICSFVEEHVYGISFGTPVVMLANLRLNQGQISCQVKCMSLNSYNIVEYLKVFRNINLAAGLIFGLAGLVCFYGGDVIRRQNKAKSFNEKLKESQNKAFEKSISKIIVVPDEEDLCVVCRSNIKSIIVQPCMHFVTCYDCYEHVQIKNGFKQCVYCRSNINSVIRVVES